MKKISKLITVTGLNLCAVACTVGALYGFFERTEETIIIAAICVVADLLIFGTIAEICGW